MWKERGLTILPFILSCFQQAAYRGHHTPLVYFAKCCAQRRNAWHQLLLQLSSCSHSCLVCSADPPSLHLLLSLTHNNIHFFQCSAGELGVFLLHTGRAYHRQQLEVPVHFLDLAYCAPFSLGISAGRITCFCALRRNVLGLTRCSEIHAELDKSLLQ